MKNIKKYDDSRQLRNNEGCLQNNRVELEKYVGAPRISLILENKKDDESEYTNGLLEKIISNENKPSV